VRRLLVVTLLLLAACSGGAGDEATIATTTTTTPTTPAPLPTGVSHDTVDVDGRSRTYRLYVPEFLSTLSPGQEVPLVLVLHGGFGSGDQVARSTSYDAQADESGFIAVYPDGSTRPDGSGARTWNGGRCCGTAVVQQVDDVAFLEALIAHVAAELPVDTDRVFAVGHSNGAIMANRLACETETGTVRAIAAVAGSLEVPCDDAPPTSVLYIHGDADENHPLEGGVGPRSVAGVDFTSVADSLDTWSTIDGCDPSPEETTDGVVTTSTWTGCGDGTSVELWVLHGAPHSWPPDATPNTWHFFESQ
jgi:polyhydroxybutyrate depolymerase